MRRCDDAPMEPAPTDSIINMVKSIPCKNLVKHKYRLVYQKTKIGFIRFGIQKCNGQIKVCWYHF